jgi:orotidine-5'-phosphate decarboxylase
MWETEGMRERIIIALDVPTLHEAKGLIDQLPDAVFFKVGLQAFLTFGPQIIAYLQKKQKRLFLDLKFKDIPNTVYGAVQSALKYMPAFATIHLTGGAAMIRSAVEAAKEQDDLTILGVTILTSLAAEDLLQMGSSLSVRQNVLKLCELGLANGLAAFVCSPQEVEDIRSRFGREVTLVTPGIRPRWAARGDQKRVFTPAMAMKAGSDYLVVGRPITQDPDPHQAFTRVLGEMSS